ncbi:MAG: alpha/beta fold hydrolase [Pseudomonadota bacterium]
MTLPLTRRTLLLGTAASTLLAACTIPTSTAPPPIVFVHGNGDSAALWITTLWRFESNGWPRERLHAIDVPYPLARDDDTRPQEGRSSTLENMQFLAAEIDRVLQATGARQLVLIANSRGGNTVRNYLANFGPPGSGASKVSHAILCGTPNHGVYADARRAPNSEFNGAGAFLAGLNAPKGPGGDEVTPGVKWLTIRSDSNDKYAQPDGAWIGAKGMATNVTFDGPALKGAENVVIPGVDHRETAYSPKAFEQMLRFITGRPPVSPAIVPETRVVLDGKVSGYLAYTAQGTVPTNLPLAGAAVEVFAVDPVGGERLGPAVHRKTIGADGRWGPFTADPQARYEFVLAASGYATTHLYRSAFPRSSSIVNLRVEKLLDADKDAAAVVILNRPRGYFGVPRDRVSLDGKSPPAGIPPGVAGVSSAKLRLADGAGRAVVGSFNDERLVGRAWPAADNAVTYLELSS